MNSLSPTVNNTDERRAQRRGRWLGAAIMLVIFLPMAVATFIYHTGIGMPTGTINKGELLTPPVALSTLALTDDNGEAWQLSQHKARWRWVISTANGCDSACEQALYLTRQAHIRLGEKAGRVERLLIVIDQPIASANRVTLLNEHPYLQVLHTDRTTFENAFGNQASILFERDAAPYFLMDPDGWLMMRYHHQHIGHHLLDDIKRMLKLSYEE